MNTNPTSLWRDFRRWLPGVIISLVALFAVFRLANWQEIQSSIKSINPLLLAAASLLTLTFLVTRAMAWRTLLEGKISVRQAFLGINIGYLLNNLFPLRAGEIGRAILLGQASGLGTMHVLSTVVIERAFDLAFAAGLLLSTLPLALGMSWAKPVAVITLSLVIAGLLALYLMARFNDLVHDWVLAAGKRSGFIERRIVPQIDNLLRGLRVLVQPGRFITSLLWIGASWLVGVVEYYIVVLSIAPAAPLWWGAFVDSVLAMGIAIPSAPAALGVFEASLVGALTILGVSTSAGLAYAVVMHFLQFAITGILGFYGLVVEGHSITSVFSDSHKTAHVDE